jgi:hypothetical protein
MTWGLECWQTGHGYPIEEAPDNQILYNPSHGCDEYQTYVYQINIPPCWLDLSEAFPFLSIGCHLMMLV